MQAGCLLQRDSRKPHVGLSLTTGRDNNKDPHLRHPMVEQLSQLWRNKTAWGDFMKRGFAALKTLSASWQQRDIRKIHVDSMMTTARDNNKDPHLRHPMVEQLSQLWRNKTAIAGLVVITVFVLTAIFAPLLSPHNPLETELYDQLKPPLWHEKGTTKYILGTDELGRDTLSRIIYGARVSLLVAIVSVGLAFFCGTLLGSFSGYYKGKIDSIIMRFMDMLLAFPYLLLAIVVVAYLGPSLQNAMMAIGITYVPRFARIVRGSVLEECGKDYVMAARAIGAGNLRIIFLAILPNCMGPLIVQTTLSMASAILDAAALSFLGLGAQPPTPEWGAMIARSRGLILRAPWVMTFPGIAILMAVLGFNLLGDGLRDALDPRLRD